jgi:hypothetical protein
MLKIHNANTTATNPRIIDGRLRSRYDVLLNAKLGLLVLMF